MSLIFNSDYRKGSIIEKVSSVIPTPYNAPKMVKTGKGLAMDFTKASSQGLNYPTTSGVVTTNDFCVEIWGKIKSGQTGTTFILRKGGASAIGYSVYVTQANGIIACDLQDAGGSTAFVSASSGFNTFHLICNYDRDGNATLYFNNVLERTTAISTRSGSIANAAVNFIVGASGTTGNDPLDGQILKCVVHDRLLTDQERNTSYAEFLASKSISKPKRGFIRNVAPAVNTIINEDFSDIDASGAATIPNGWSQISGTTKGGEINIAKGTLTSTFVLAGITGVTATGYTHAYVGGSGAKNIACGNPAYAGVLGKNYVARFKLTINSGALSAAIQVSGMGSSLTNIVSGYNTYNMYGSNGSNGTYFTINSTTDCTYKISEFTLIEIEPLTTVKQGSKYLEQVTPGVTVIPCNIAYGTYEFDFYKGATANDPRMHIIAGSIGLYPNYQGVYLFRPSDTENITLYKGNGSTATALMVTAASYIKNNTWYRVRITRTTAGIFTMLIKGGTFTPTAGYNGWTLVVLTGTGGSGTNPTSAENTYVSSSYFVIDLDQGDRISGLTILDGIKV